MLGSAVDGAVDGCRQTRSRNTATIDVPDSDFSADLQMLISS